MIDTIDCIEGQPTLSGHMSRPSQQARRGWIDMLVVAKIQKGL